MGQEQKLISTRKFDSDQVKIQKGEWNWFKNGVQTKELMFTHFFHQWSTIIRYWWFNFTVYWYKIQCWLWNMKKKSGKDTGLIIESKSEIESPTQGLGLHSCSISISEKG